MKVDRAKLARCANAEIPTKARALIDSLQGLEQQTFCQTIAANKDWNFGKTELGVWADVLDTCDEILAQGTAKVKTDSWFLEIDKHGNEALLERILHVLEFTAQLFEHTYTRHLYNSMERILILLDSGNIRVVVSAMKVLYVFSKRSAFLLKVPEEQRKTLVSRLLYIAESWGGSYSGLSLAKCCKSDEPLSVLPISFNLQIEGSDSGRRTRIERINTVDANKPCTQQLDELLESQNVAEGDRAQLLCRLRLACSFPHPKLRQLCVLARLMATSVLVYSRSLDAESETSAVLYNGFVEELVEVLRLEESKPFDALDEIRTETLKTLTSIIYLDRAPKLQLVVEALAANSYHGFLASLTRSCIEELHSRRLVPRKEAANAAKGTISVDFCTALFSFLYHLAGYDNGAEALVSCGLTESLLSVVSDLSLPFEHVSFATRSVRVIDLVTAIDVQPFLSAGGLQTLINRLVHETELCRREQPFEIRVAIDPDPTQSETSTAAETSSVESMEVEAGPSDAKPAEVYEPVSGVRCNAQRAALMKSLMNFVKKAIQDPQLAEAARHIMEGPLPNVLKHLISNPTYYGAALFQIAISVTTDFIYQEPSQLSTLQDKGLTNVILEALLVREVPASREILASLPTTFAANCLNERGLQSFMKYKPFEKLFKVLLSTKYLQAMKRNRNSDPVGDTAMALGSAVDELMRHQPTLKQAAMQAVVQLLDQLVNYGTDPRYTCVSKLSTRQPPNAGQAEVGGDQAGQMSHQASTNESSDDDEEDEDNGVEVQSVSMQVQPEEHSDAASETTSCPVAAVSSVSVYSLGEEEQSTSIPLLDYIQNTMKFLEAILTNHATDEHGRLFVAEGGMDRLAKLVNLPNAPVDFPQSSACQSVAGVIRFIVSQTKNAALVEPLLKQLNTQVIPAVQPYLEAVPSPGGSRLVANFLQNSNGTEAAYTPILKAFAPLQSHLHIITHLAKVAFASPGQIGTSDLKSQLLKMWTSECGLSVVSQLHSLYQLLVWESSVMLAVCSAETGIPKGSNFANDQLEQLRHKVAQKAAKGKQNKGEPMETDAKVDVPSSAVAAEQKSETTQDSTTEKSDSQPATNPIVSLLKPVVSVSSKVGRHLSDLFTLLVKACLSGQGRMRRGQPPVPLPPTAEMFKLSAALMKECKKAFEWRPPPDSAPHKLRLTYLICTSTFIVPFLFDERNQAYHVLLDKFYHTGCHRVCFQAFSSVLEETGVSLDKIEKEQLPEGTEEFLEAWLVLVEKLVHPEGILNTQHVIAATDKNTKQPKPAFEPLQYLMCAQRDAFTQLRLIGRCLRLFKDKKVAELTLAVLRQLIRGVNMVQKEMNKDTAVEKKEKEQERKELERHLNNQHIQQLTDMGFPREMVVEALIEYGSVQDATEWLLSQPQLMMAANQQDEQLMAAVMSEEEQLARAIAMSLAQDANLVAAAAAGQPPPAAPPAAPEAPAPAAPVDQPPAEAPEPMPEAPEGAPPSTADSEESSSIRLSAGGDVQSKETPSTSSAPEVGPSSLAPPLLKDARPLDTTELFEFVEKSAVPLCLELIDANPELVYRTADLISVIVKQLGQDWAKDVLLGKELVLQVQELSKTFVEAVQKREQSVFGSPATHALRARVHLLCFLFEEMGSLCVNECAQAGIDGCLLQVLDSALSVLLEKTQSDDLKSPKLLAPLLLWFDLFDKVTLQSRRKEAFEAKVGAVYSWRYWDNRQWVAFGPAQNKVLNEAFQGGQKTISFTVSRRNYTVNFVSMTQTNSDSGFQRPVLFVPQEESKPPTEDPKMETDQPEDSGLSLEQSSKLVSYCVRLLDCDLDADTLNALFRLALRLTRQFGLASDFLHLGGLRTLLSLKKDKNSFVAMDTLMALLVRNVLEDEATLKHTMEKVVRAVGQGSQTPRQGRFEQRNARQSQEFHYALRTLAPVACRKPELFLNVAKDTLRFAQDEGMEIKVEQTAGTCPSAIDTAPSPNVKHVLSILLDHLQNAQASESHVTRSSVLKLLSELVRSYSSVALFVAEYRTPEVDCSTLAHLLDSLLCPPPPPEGTPKDVELVECAVGVKTLVATLSAACYKAQESLVTEVKSAIQRAVAKPDSQAKYQQLTTLVMLVSLMHESCPTLSANNQPPTQNKQPSVTTNTMLRLLHRKKMCVDLARIPLHLDLSNTESINTINSVLKTLEDLTRLINAPVNNQATQQQRAAQQQQQAQAQAQAAAPQPEPAAPPQSAQASITVSSGDTLTTEATFSSTTTTTTTTTSGSVSEPPSEAVQQAAAAQQALQSIQDAQMIPPSPPPQDESRSSSSSSSGSSDDEIGLTDSGDSSDSDEPMVREPEHDHEHVHDDAAGNEAGSEHSDYEMEEDDEDTVVNDGVVDEEPDDDDEDDEDDGVDEEDFLDQLEQELNTPDMTEGFDMVLGAALRHYVNDPDMFGRPARLFVHTPGGGLNIPDVERYLAGDVDAQAMFGAPTRAQRRAAVFEHPLLQRDAPVVTAEASQGQTVYRPFSNLLQNLNVRTAAPRGWQYVRPGAGLHRQGAVRDRLRMMRRGAAVNNNNDHILHRLFGMAGAEDLPAHVQLRFAEHGAPARVLVAPEANAYRDMDDLEELHQGRQLSASVPSALSRWNEQSHVLDGAGCHILLALIKIQLENALQAHRKVDKEKKKQEEEKKKAEQAEKVTVEDGKDKSVQVEESVQSLETAVERVEEAVERLADTLQREEQPEPMDQSEAPVQNGAENETEAQTPQEMSETTAREEEPEEEVAAPAPSQPAPEPIEPEPESNITTASNVTVNSTDSGEVSSAAAEPPAAHENGEQMEETPETAETVETANQEANPETEEQQNVRQAQLEEYRELLGGMDIPEGVDPAFLAALPDHMRREVIEDHLRTQRVARMRQEAQTTAARPAEAAPDAATAAAAAAPAEPSNAAAAAAPEQQPNTVPEISQEFLDALPPELQEEVLNQQRLAREQNAPRRPVQDIAADPASFFETLPPSLRQQVLADADDSVIQVLPAHLAAEARRLRDQLDRITVDRLATMHTFLGRGGGAGLTVRHGGWMHSHSRIRVDQRNATGVGSLAGVSTQQKLSGVQLLDKEALCSLIILFFLDNSRLNSGRLQKILKSLCCHGPTCDFLVRSLLSVLEQVQNSPAKKSIKDRGVKTATWLDGITIATGLGNRMNVLELIQRAREVDVAVHPLAAPTVARHVLDTLISLAKAFPAQFLPAVLRSSEAKEADGSGQSEDNNEHEFWTIVSRLNQGHGTLDTPSKTPRTKGLNRSQSFSMSDEVQYRSLEEAPVGRLMCMLNRALITETSALLDRLVRLLSQVVMTLPDDTLERLNGGTVPKPRPVVLEPQLKLVVNVVTRSKCGDEGLNDARTLLMESARTLGLATRNAIYKLLLDSAVELGNELSNKTGTLLAQLGQLAKTDEAGSSGQSSVKGTVSDRYDEGRTVVVSGRNMSKATPSASSCQELQLDAVGELTSKYSAQHLLLRTLQTVIQMREAMKARDQKLQQEARNAVKIEEETERRMNEAETPEGETEEQRRERRQIARQEAVRTVLGPAARVPAADEAKVEEPETNQLDETALSALLGELDPLWDVLSRCLRRLGEATDPHAVLVLQPAAETFFLVHANKPEPEQPAAEAQAENGQEQAEQPPQPEQEQQPAEVPLLRGDSLSMSQTPADADTKKMITFAQEHRRVLNQVLRQSNQHLSDGPFAVLIQFPRLLDFDVKRRYFRKELQRLDQRNHLMRREDVPLRIRRDQLFMDSFRELFRLRPQEWKNRFYIIFEGEEGQDAGGVLREWYCIITREIFNPMYALFTTSPGDRVTYMINRSSYVNPEHIEYFKFVGRLIAKQIYDNKLSDCYFTRAFYKHILNKPVRYQDIEAEDPAFYQSLEFMLNNPIEQLGTDFNFTVEVEEFGRREMRELKPGGNEIYVTDENKKDYVQLVCQMKMTGSITKQLESFLLGFYEIIPKRLISIFDEQEIELLISGLPTIDIDDLQQNTEYRGYNKNSIQVQWFWRALRSFEPEDRAKLLQFVTGTSKVPLQGFASLEGMNGVQKFSIHMDARSTDRLPAAHTCFNQLDLPAYDSYDKLHHQLLLAVQECSEGFGFA